MVKLFWMPLLIVALALSYVYAAEPANDEEELDGVETDAVVEEGLDGVETDAVVEEKPMTQGELAVAIVRMLGLDNELPPDATELDYAMYLRGRGVGPLPDLRWDVNAVATNDVVAVVVVQVTGLAYLVEDKDNIEHYTRVLEERGLLLTNVRDVLSEIEVVNPLVQIWPGAADPYEDNQTPTRGR